MRCGLGSDATSVVATKDPGGRFNNWHIDHEKGTRNVRGLLCSYCNTVLGLMAHDPARLRAAADYLEA